MRLEIIDSIEQFAALKPQYLQLLEASGAATPFATHRWLEAWWRAYEGEMQARVCCFVEDDRLVAAVPVMFSASTLGKVNVSRISTLGGGWGLVDPPARPDAGGAWASEWVDWLFDRSGIPWHVLSLGPALADAPGTAALAAALRLRHVSFRPRGQSSPFLPLTGTWEEFLARRSHNFRRTAKRKIRAATADGRFSIERIIDPTPEQIRSTVFAVSRVSWQGEAGVAVAATAAGRHFYELLLAGSGEFQTDLTVLRTAEGGCAGYLLGFTRDRVYHAFDTGFDPSAADVSPGMAVHFASLQALFGTGLTEFNFGHGHGYKDRFEPEVRDANELTVYRTAIISGYGRLVDGARNLLQR